MSAEDKGLNDACWIVVRVAPFRGAWLHARPQLNLRIWIVRRSDPPNLAHFVYFCRERIWLQTCEWKITNCYSWNNLKRQTEIGWERRKQILNMAGLNIDSIIARLLEGKMCRMDVLPSPLHAKSSSIMYSHCCIFDETKIINCRFFLTFVHIQDKRMRRR